MIVIFTDFDGTLLDDSSYSFEPAHEALAEVRIRKIPLILCTSKTRAETEAWRSQLQNQDPFVVENRGAAFIPNGYFKWYSPELRDRYEVLAFGTPHLQLVRILRECSVESETPIRAFHTMSAAELALESGLTIEHAELAKRREYDEPFTIVDGKSPEALRRAVASRGYRVVRGVDTSISPARTIKLLQSRSCLSDSVERTETSFRWD